MLTLRQAAAGGKFLEIDHQLHYGWCWLGPLALKLLETTVVTYTQGLTGEVVSYCIVTVVYLSFISD